jgi:hypothetical protein
LTKNIIWVVTLRENEPEILPLFLSGKLNRVYSSTPIFSFTNELTKVSHIPARNKAVILLSSKRHEDKHIKHIDKKNITNLTSCTKMPLKLGLTLWTHL